MPTTRTVVRAVLHTAIKTAYCSTAVVAALPSRPVATYTDYVDRTGLWRRRSSARRIVCNNPTRRTICVLCCCTVRVVPSRVRRRVFGFEDRTNNDLDPDIEYKLVFMKKFWASEVYQFPTTVYEHVQSRLLITAHNFAVIIYDYMCLTYLKNNLNSNQYKFEGL